jgi:TolA-binding protein
MRWIVYTASALVVIVLSWTAAAPAAQETEERVKAKLQEVQKKLSDLDTQKAKLLEVQQQLEEAQRKIEALRKQEEALKKDLEQKAREKDYYVKVEIKGRLSHAASTAYGFPQTEKTWQVTAQGGTWELDLSKKFVELAKKAEGKTVVVSGTQKAAQPWKNYGWPQPTYPNPNWPTYPPGPGSSYSTAPIHYYLLSLPVLTVTDLQLVD